jgi:DNA repair exonuclease SbcCD ATPase subunit
VGADLQISSYEGRASFDSESSSDDAMGIVQEVSERTDSRDVSDDRSSRSHPDPMQMRARGPGRYLSSDASDDASELRGNTWKEETPRRGPRGQDADKGANIDIATKMSLVKDVLDLQEQVQSLHALLQERDAELAKSSEKIRSLHKDKQALETERANFVQDHGSAFEAELEQALRAAKSARDELAEKQQRIDELSSEAERWEREEALLRQRLEDKERELIELKHAVTHPSPSTLNSEP